jgi:hypothetical protein
MVIEMALPVLFGGDGRRVVSVFGTVDASLHESAKCEINRTCYDNK